MMIKKSIKGTFFLGETRTGFLPANVVNSVKCVNTKDESYVDDVNICFENENDLLIVDQIFTKFEAMSGAILNRDSKTKVMGVGDWQGKQDWVLPWVKVEKNLKIFGIRFFPSYQEILDVNWAEAKKGFVDCLNSWNLRSLETILQKIEVLKIFALPKIYFKALLLPLPGKLAGQFEEEMRQFIWRAL